MTREQQDQQIANLVRRKHAAKREIACLEEKLKTVHRGLSALNAAVYAQAWTRMRREENRVWVDPDPEQRDTYPVSIDDLSLGEIADMGQRILQLTDQIKADEQSLLRCLGEEKD